MDVPSVGECRKKGFVAGKVREDAQFDLGIVRNEVFPSCFRGLETSLDSVGITVSRGDVLQVGRLARHASRRCSELIVRGADPSVFADIF